MASVAASAGVLSAAALWAYSVFVPRCQFWAPVIRSIPQSDAVALTFDDGPHPVFTPQILDILARYEAHATFFVIGRFAAEHPGIIRRIHQEGHAIGNHTLDHDHFGVNQKFPYWQRQLGETQKIVGDITGQPPYLFRPPMGFKTRHLARAARELHLPIVAWSLRAYDTRPVSTEKIANRIIKGCGGHEIVAMHDGLEPARSNASQQNTVDALPMVLEALRVKNIAAVSLLKALLRPS
jgi:peptidoglycan/xylan/chitin deacetylase (PgdA/CDA1 family)